jgi:predicted dehydrogenase
MEGDWGAWQVTQAAIEAGRVWGYGLIGAGLFGQFCLQHYRQMPQIRAVAVTDLNAAVAREAAAATGAQMCGSVAELLARADIDLVHIATPPFTHRMFATEALQAGKHVLCEKPLATTLADGEYLVGLAKEKGLVLAVNLIMRYNPLCRIVKQIVDERMLGEPLHGYFENYAQDEVLAPDHWFWDPQKAGGIFIEHGVHFFDLFRWWLGAGEVVAAQYGARAGRGMVDQANCTVRYKDDVLVNMYHGFTQALRMDRQELRLLFERGSLTLYEWVPTSMRIDCIQSHEELDRLKAQLPGAEVRTVESYSGASTRVSSRQKTYEVDGRFEVSYRLEMDKPTLYGHVLRSLLADQIQAIMDRGHVRLVDENNGYESLKMAVAADELAHR